MCIDRYVTSIIKKCLYYKFTYAIHTFNYVYDDRLMTFAYYRTKIIQHLCQSAAPPRRFLLLLIS